MAVGSFGVAMCAGIVVYKAGEIYVRVICSKT